jgi:hypothetical protein
VAAVLLSCCTAVIGLGQGNVRVVKLNDRENLGVVKLNEEDPKIGKVVIRISHSKADP